MITPEQLALYGCGLIAIGGGIMSIAMGLDMLFSILESHKIIKKL
jgi:hypothetical protein